MNYKYLNKGINKLIVTIFSIFLVIFIFWLLLFSVPGQNGNLLVKNLFYDWIFSKRQILEIFSVFAPFLIGSLSVLLCYKSGLVNVFVAGQMSLSGLVIYFTGYGLKKIQPNVNWFPLLVLSGIIASVFLSLIVAFLKIYFNINEVLTGIFFNFIVMFLFRFLVKQKEILDPIEKLSTKESLGIIIQYNFAILEIIPISMIISIVIFTFIGYLIFKTRYGLKLKMLNKYKKSVRYTGIDYKKNVFKIFLISGIISGVAGMFYYFKTIESNKLYLNEALPNNGFDTITIVWLSQYSVIGLPFVSFFMALIRCQQNTIPISHLTSEVSQVVIGFILLLVPFFNQLFFNEEQKLKIKFIFNKFIRKIKNNRRTV